MGCRARIRQVQGSIPCLVQRWRRVPGTAGIQTRRAHLQDQHGWAATPWKRTGSGAGVSHGYGTHVAFPPPGPTDTLVSYGILPATKQRDHHPLRAEERVYRSPKDHTHGVHCASVQSGHQTTSQTCRHTSQLLLKSGYAGLPHHFSMLARCIRGRNPWILGPCLRQILFLSGQWT